MLMLSGIFDVNTTNSYYPSIQQLIYFQITNRFFIEDILWPKEDDVIILGSDLIMSSFSSPSCLITFAIWLLLLCNGLASCDLKIIVWKCERFLLLSKSRIECNNFYFSLQFWGKAVLVAIQFVYYKSDFISIMEIKRPQYVWNNAIARNKW